MSPDILTAIAADPAMDFLRPALLPESVAPVLARAVGREVEVAAIRGVRHKHGRRCVIDYDLRSGTESTRTLVAKVRVKGVDRRTFTLVRTLRESGFHEDAPDGIHIPEPLEIVPEFRMLLTAKASGVPAGELLHNSEDGDLARRIAAIAWKLHSAGVPSQRTHTVKDELSILGDRFAKVGAAHPELSDRLAKIFERCECIASRLPPVSATGIHRDFYPAQVLVDGLRSWLLDLDLYCIGDPAIDVGNFIGHMTEH